MGGFKLQSSILKYSNQILLTPLDKIQIQICTYKIDTKMNKKIIKCKNISTSRNYCWV